MHLWNHLPPECFEQLYDALQVDVWSVAVLMIFCLTGSMPFTTPFTMPQAITQWTEFKRSHQSMLKAITSTWVDLIEQIFVPEEYRLKAGQLFEKTVPEKLLSQRQRSRCIDNDACAKSAMRSRSRSENRK